MNAAPEPQAGPAGPVRLSGGRTMLLDRPDLGRRVVAGALDVFLVRMVDGAPAGPRRHFFTAGTGMTLFGLPPEVSGDWRLLAAGAPEGEAAPIEAPSAADRDNWLGSLLAALIGRPTLTTRIRSLSAGTTSVFPAGARLGPGETLLWARLGRGAATYLEAGPGFGPIAPMTFVPLSGRAWLNVVEEAEIEVADTAELMAKGTFDAVVSAFYRRYFDDVAGLLAEEERDRRRRLAVKAERDRSVLAGALAKVVAVLRPDRRSLLDAVSADAPLMAACRLTASASRIALAGGFVPDPGGRPLDQVAELAMASGFRIRRVVLEKDWFLRDHGPLLVFRSGDMAPAAALPRGAGRYELCDPASGRTTVIDAALARELAPDACMLYTPFPDRPLRGLDLLVFSLRGQKTDLATVLGVGAVAAALGLVAPILTATVIDTVIPGADTGLLTQIGALLVACALAATVFEIAKGVALLRIEGKVDSRVQSAVTDRLLGLPASFFKGYSSGDLASRCLGVNAIHSILSGVAVNAVLAAVFSTLNLGLLFFYDWRLALVANAFVLANMILVAVISGFAVKKQRALIDLGGQKQGMELEYLTGINKLRLTGAESRAFGAWAEVFSRSAALGYQSGSAFNLVSAVNAAFPTLTTMVLYYMYFSYRLEALDLGRFLAFFAAFAAFQVAMIQLVSALSTSLAVIPLYERVRPILTAAPEVDAAKARPKALRGAIEISHVVFRYEPGGRKILSDLSLRADPGEFVALVGDSGAGKSTVLRLLLGFETPESGAVYYDGQDLRELDARAVRRQIGVVLQDDKPSAGSLLSNIAGSANLSPDEAWEAARMAGLEEDIKAMPMGMQTVVPPGGAGFSGGQIQRLLIARALARRPGLLFFDEATSALDNATQAMVSRSIAALRVTRLVIAHRLSTVMSADRIYALRQGQLAEVGTFQQLMDKKGFFYELAKRQMA